MDSTADRKLIAAKEKQAKADAASRAQVVINLMSTISGREWIWHLLTTCHVFHTTFTGEALTSAFSEGQRDIGQKLLSEIMTACPDLYIQAMRDANDRRTTAERRSSPIDNGRDTGREGRGDDPEAGDGDSFVEYGDDLDIYTGNGTGPH